MSAGRGGLRAADRLRRPVDASPSRCPPAPRSWWSTPASRARSTAPPTRSVGPSARPPRIALGPLGQLDPHVAGAIPDPVLRRRARHVASECAAGAVRSPPRCEPATWPRRGASCRRAIAAWPHDFEVSTPGLDSLVESLVATPRRLRGPADRSRLRRLRGGADRARGARPRRARAPRRGGCARRRWRPPRSTTPDARPTTGTARGHSRSSSSAFLEANSASVTMPRRRSSSSCTRRSATVSSPWAARGTRAMPDGGVSVGHDPSRRPRPRRSSAPVPTRSRTGPAASGHDGPVAQGVDLLGDDALHRGGTGHAVEDHHAGLATHLHVELAGAQDPIEDRLVVRELVDPLEPQFEPVAAEARPSAARCGWW